MAQFLANVDLPSVPFHVAAPAETECEPSVAPPEPDVQLVVPNTEDATRGALTMAVWAVPKIAPWLDVLVASLQADPTPLSDLAIKVEAPWWRFPPWDRPRDLAEPSGPQECLWLAALGVLRRGGSDPCLLAASAIADQIALIASQRDPGNSAQAISEWREATHRILRAEASIRLGRWRDCPVGTAIQMVLARPDPVDFKQWFKDLPDIPPAIAWQLLARRHLRARAECRRRPREADPAH